LASSTLVRDTGRTSSGVSMPMSVGWRGGGGARRCWDRGEVSVAQRGVGGCGGPVDSGVERSTDERPRG